MKKSKKNIKEKIEDEDCRMEVSSDAFSEQKQVPFQSILGFRHLTLKSDQLLNRVKITGNAPNVLQNFLGGWTINLKIPYLYGYFF